MGCSFNLIPNLPDGSMKINDIENAIGEFIPEDPDDKWTQIVNNRSQLIEFEFKNLGTVNKFVTKFKLTTNFT